MVLYINTKDKNKIEVVLKDNKVIDSLVAENEYGSQVLLLLIDKLLKKNKVKLENLGQIEVETGPGSFTGLRVGVTVANALAFALNIPINNKKIEDTINY